MRTFKNLMKEGKINEGCRSISAVPMAIIVSVIVVAVFFGNPAKKNLRSDRNRSILFYYK